jgi:hypothetical protein
MSLHIYIAHTGEHLLADPVSFASYVCLVEMELLPAEMQCELTQFTVQMPSDHGLHAIHQSPRKGKS